MNTEDIIGIVAISLSLSYRIPQIYKIYINKSARDISLWMLWIQNTSYAPYIVYGILKDDWLWWFSSAMSIIQNLIILALYMWYKGGDGRKLQLTASTNQLFEKPV